MTLSPHNLLLTRLAAAKYIVESHHQPCSRSALAHLAVSGEGPTFHYIGRFPFYYTDDLDAWALGRIGAPLRSTRERSSVRLSPLASEKRETKK